MKPALHRLGYATQCAAWLAALVLASISLAACSSETIVKETATHRPIAASATARPPSETPPAASAAAEPSKTPKGASDMNSELDLQEANVLAVAFSPIKDETYRFEVTLVHDDDAEAPSFADRWVVEDEAGHLLGERVLLHSHGTVPFTRSEIIHIPSGMNRVIVRGHDMQHGFGGQAALVDLTTGEITLFDEGTGPPE